MAVKKKTSIKRKTNKSSISNQSKKNFKEDSKESLFKNEIIFVVLVLSCVFILLSYFGLCGLIGNYMSQFIFGLLGILAYLFPFLVLIGYIVLISNKENKKIRHKVYYGSCIYIILTALIQWCIDKPVDSIGDFYINSAEGYHGGGFIGGTISYSLEMVLGRVGSFLVLMAMLLILFILFTGKMLFTAIHELFMNTEEDDIINVEKTPNKPKNINTKQNRMTSYKFSKEDEQPKETLEEKELGLNIIRSDVQKKETPRYEEELNQKFGKKEVEVSVPNQNSTQVEKTTSNKKPQHILEEKEIHKELEQATKVKTGEKTPSVNYKFPFLDLLAQPNSGKKRMSNEELTATAIKLKETLESFGVFVKMGDISCGPSVTRYELSPEQGVKVGSITRLADDIKLSLAASDIRIEAPIPGKAAVGIEVPNKEKTMVTFRELLESSEFEKAKSKVSFAVGKDIAGKTVVADVAKMPHLLVAGATGSGKSVCINTLIMSILYKAHPDEVKMILIDPKMVEFGVYNDIPHLMIPVVTDPKKASAALNWAVAEMTGRYNKFSEMGVRNIEGYNKRIAKMTVKTEVSNYKPSSVEKPTSEDENFEPMPQVVIIVDEFADLMMVAPGEVEDAICRLAQLARAAGIHLVLATQRPSVNVITGLIKANIPSRIALSVSSTIDSRTIIDGGGAEKLLGNGDMLFSPGDFPKPVRIQGAYISEKEVSKVVDFLKKQFDTPTYDSSVSEQIESVQNNENGGKNSNGSTIESSNARDELFVQAAQFIIEKDKASIGMLQRVFRIGFNRAARIMDQLCEAGVVGQEEGTKPRTILMSEEQFESYLEENG